MNRIIEESDLKLISAYWCSSVCAQYEERFDWARDEIEERVSKIGESARSILEALALTAPDMRTLAYFAAGPLENYINHIVSKKHVDEAAKVKQCPGLQEALKMVWGDVEKLDLLSNGITNKADKLDSIQFEGLENLEPKVAMGFWCRVTGSKVSEDYDAYYHIVTTNLTMVSTRKSTVHDLITTAPDHQAITFLDQDIFILTKD